MTLSAVTKLRLAGAALVLAAVAVLAVACGGGSGRSESPEGVARRAVQALIDDDISGLLAEVRPDSRTKEQQVIEKEIDSQVDAVRACKVGNVLVPENVLGVGEYVSVMFRQPCGDSGDTTKCELKMVKLSGRFYLESHVFYCG